MKQQQHQKYTHRTSGFIVVYWHLFVSARLSIQNELAARRFILSPNLFFPCLEMCAQNKRAIAEFRKEINIILANWMWCVEAAYCMSSGCFKLRWIENACFKLRHSNINEATRCLCIWWAILCSLTKWLNRKLANGTFLIKIIHLTHTQISVQQSIRRKNHRKE